VSALDDLAAAWRAARTVVVLTGAGMSTASGIPDFRSPGGRWSHYRPVTIQEFLASEDDRARYWRYKGETWQVISAAQPNAGHVALAELAGADRVALLVTQNVDGLHERSGFPPERLVTIHGSDAAVECVRCGRRAGRALAQRAWEAGEAVPRCSCGGPWKPATISFGQALVQADLMRALDAAGSCDLLVAAGTSLVVGPINEMVPRARRAGARAAILTTSETPFDDVADWKLSEPVEELLPSLSARVLSPRAAAPAGARSPLR
jgi:NAD-dependent deacetylase